MSMAPRDFPDDDDDGDHSQPDPHDDADLGFDAGPPAGALDPLAAFLKELEDLDSMSGPDINLKDACVMRLARVMRLA